MPASACHAVSTGRSYSGGGNEARGCEPPQAMVTDVSHVTNNPRGIPIFIASRSRWVIGQRSDKAPGTTSRSWGKPPRVLK